MTLLRLVREPSDFGKTFGSLWVNDVWQCFTLEDVIREPREQGIIVDRVAWVESWKVHGQTAIPAGRYVVKLTFSNRFQRITPEIIGVPGYLGIRFHPGNKAEDTDGCVLPGERRGEKTVLNSKVAYDQLMLRLTGNPNDIVIDIENPPGRYLSPGSPAGVVNA